MNLEEAIRTRRSVRGFLPAEVPTAVLHKAFELAQYAPSGCNLQPWVPHVVSGPSLRRLSGALLETASTGMPPNPDWYLPAKYSGVYRERQHDSAARLYGAMGIERHDLDARQAAALRNFAFFDAPHVVFIFLPRPFDTREVADMGMYAQTLMLAMTAHGVASCAQGALSMFPDVVRSHLGLSDEQRLLFGISFGYEDTGVKANAARIGRVDVHEAVRFHS